MIRKLVSGKYRLYSLKKDPKTGRRRNLGTFATRAAAEKHEREVEFFKRRGKQSARGGRTKGAWTRALSMLITISLLRTGPAFSQAPRVHPAIPSVRVAWTGTPLPQSRLSLPSGNTRFVTIESWRSDASPRTYWLEGAVIGAVALGVTSHLAYRAVAASLCTGSDAGGCNDYRTHVTVGGAAVGFLVGALIGRRHLKHGETAAAPPE